MVPRETPPSREHQSLVGGNHLPGAPQGPGASHKLTPSCPQTWRHWPGRRGLTWPCNRLPRPHTVPRETRCAEGETASPRSCLNLSELLIQILA